MRGGAASFIVADTLTAVSVGRSRRRCSYFENSSVLHIRGVVRRQVNAKSKNKRLRQIQSQPLLGRKGPPPILVLALSLLIILRTFCASALVTFAGVGF